MINWLVTTSCIWSPRERAWFSRPRDSLRLACSATIWLDSSDSRAFSTSSRSSVATMPLLFWKADRRDWACSSARRRLRVLSSNRWLNCLAGSVRSSSVVSI